MAPNVSARIFAPQGALTMATAGPLFRDVERALQEGPVQLDLGAIDRVDSAALALIVSLLRKDKRKHHIRFQNVPATIVNFAEIYGLEDVLSTHLPQ